MGEIFGKFENELPKKLEKIETNPFLKKNGKCLKNWKN